MVISKIKLKKMKNGNNLIKISGGLAVMFSVFLLLTIATKINQNKAFYANIFKIDKENTLASTNINIQNNPMDKKVIKGTFDIKTPADSILDKNGEKYHYKKISSEKFKVANITPLIKFEVNKNEQLSWKQIPWDRIDNQTGDLYFLFGIENNGAFLLSQEFTGNYQVILE